ncbi:MAG: hypothetical protein WCQ96_03445 [Patescibacteria group bacterium]
MLSLEANGGLIMEKTKETMEERLKRIIPSSILLSEGDVEDEVVTLLEKAYNQAKVNSKKFLENKGLLAVELQHDFMPALLSTLEEGIRSINERKPTYEGVMLYLEEVESDPQKINLIFKKE